jgi:hypothetical protein
MILLGKSNRASQTGTKSRSRWTLPKPARRRCRRDWHPLKSNLSAPRWPPPWLLEVQIPLADPSHLAARKAVVFRQDDGAEVGGADVGARRRSEDLKNRIPAGTFLRGEMSISDWPIKATIAPI